MFSEAYRALVLRTQSLRLFALRASITAMALAATGCDRIPTTAPAKKVASIEVRAIDRPKPEFTTVLRSGGYTINLGDIDDDGDMPILVRGPSGYGQIRCSSIAANGKLLKNDYANWLDVPIQTGISTSPDAAHIDCWAKHGL